MMPMGRDELAVKPVRHDVSPDFLALSAPAVSRVDHRMGELHAGRVDLSKVEIAR